MQYYIIFTDPKTGKRGCFTSDYFTPENHYNPEFQMIVIDLYNGLVTFDGSTWEEIEFDHL